MVSFADPHFHQNFEDNFDVIIVEAFPDFIKDKIKSSDEYKFKMNPESSEDMIENEHGEINSNEPIIDDLPF